MQVRYRNPFPVVWKEDVMHDRGHSGLIVRTAVVVLVAFAAPPALAQTGSVTGTVVEASGRRPIVGAQVSVKGTGLATQAGEGGRFTIANIPAGAHVIAVRQIGFAAG